MPGKQPKVSRAGGVRCRATDASTGLTTIERQAAAPPNDVAELHRAIEGDGGKVLAINREPLALDDQIVEKVETLKAKGLTSPYLKSFEVARVNPSRFRSKEASPLSFDEAFDRMASATAKFNPEKIKMEDVARSGGAVEEPE